MFAVIETGGKQYKVAEGDVLFIEKLDVEAGDKVTFDKVLAILDGENATFGTPVVEGASVEAKAIKNGKGIAFAVPMSSIIGVNLYQFMSNNRLGRE